MNAPADLHNLNPDQLRELAARLMAEVRTKQALIDKLTYEMATLKRLKFAAASEAYTGEHHGYCSRRSRPISQRCRPKSGS